MVRAVEERKQPKQGWVEAASRILGQLLRSTRTKDNLRLILNNLDPHNAAELVRVSLQTDPAVPLWLLGALPQVTNIVVEAGRELAAQLARKPRTLVQEAGRGLWQRIHLEHAGEAAGLLTSVLLNATSTTRSESQAESSPGRFWRGFAAATQQQLGCSPLEALAPLLVDWLGALAGEAEQLLEQDDTRAQAMRDLAQSVRQILERNPELRRQVVTPLMESLREE